MPLSEHEQRLLDEMERNLYGHDADVTSTAFVGMPRPNYRAIILGVVIALAGLGGLIAGVMVQNVLIGIAGFAAMFAGVLVASKPGAPAPAATTSSTSTKKSSGSSFIKRMEQRWDERDNGRL
jgi:predicted lipid-binding transport protein (Tim44 family)